MQKAVQYRQFAETLVEAALTADAATRDVLLTTAQTWCDLADAVDAPPSQGAVIDFAAERLRRRLAS